ncbi:hypothetical protein [Candidatus Poriferisocius sp.]|uniref:hypothetical protein n=1 Tax=Candidatus Poriferisocius sp. TaxID=3101276 RepID=UPI003B01F17F
MPSEEALVTGSATPSVLATPTAAPSEDPVPTSTSLAVEPDQLANPTSTPEPVPLTDAPISAAPAEPFEGTMHVIYPSAEPLPGGTTLEGEPFGTTGDMPVAIIASTEQCDVVSIDVQSGITTTLWEYNMSEETFLYCGERGTEHPEYPDAEVPPGFIRDVEWVEPRSVLLRMCCDPSGQGFELLDIEKREKRYWLPYSIWYTSVDGQRTLLVESYALRDSRDGLASLRSGPVVFSEFASDRRDYSYEAFGDLPYHHLVLDSSRASDQRWEFGRSIVVRSTWVGEDAVAVVVRTFVSGLGWYPWLAKISLDKSATDSNVRGLGWMLPAGDQQGNLVVAEQFCLPPPEVACNRSSAKVVVVDSETLDPLYEVEVDDAINDMDLERGWLLVTLVDGRMGVLDLADGTFNVLASGIRNAVWQE